ncbi:MAG: hypothetical protein SNH35_05300 [Rikenellaceae bacterium]
MKRLIITMTVIGAIAMTSCSTALDLLLQPLPTLADFTTTNITTKLIGCSKVGHTATITFEITNHSNFDEKISIGRGNVKLYDNVGYIYDSRNSNITIGIGGDKQGGSATAIFPQKVPVSVTIMINDIASNATHFRVIEVGASSSGRMKLNPANPIIIRNIAWGR